MLDSIDFYKEISYSFSYYSFLVIISLCLLHRGKCHSLQQILSKNVNSIPESIPYKFAFPLCVKYTPLLFSLMKGETPIPQLPQNIS